MAGHDASTSKRLTHNANERDRRKKLNGLYSQLQLLLPNTSSKGKLYNPTIVCEALNYIPQLCNQVKELSRQRDELLTTKRISECSVLTVPGNSEYNTDLSGSSAHSDSPIITINRAFERPDQLAITIITCKVGGLVFSTLLFLFEQLGMDVFDASMFVAGENVCYSIHLQMKAKIGDLDIAALHNKIMFLWLSSEKRDEA